LYGYVGNSPTNAIDPAGLATVNPYAPPVHDYNPFVNPYANPTWHQNPVIGTPVQHPIPRPVFLGNPAVPYFAFVSRGNPGPWEFIVRTSGFGSLNILTGLGPGGSTAAGFTNAPTGYYTGTLDSIGSGEIGGRVYRDPLHN
jgi:hypothetical protein